MRCVSRQLTKPSAPLGALTCVSWQRPECVAGEIGLELANVALTRRDLNRSLPGVREKSLVRKCCVNPRSSAEITKNRHFRVRVLSPQPRSPVSVGRKSPLQHAGWPMRSDALARLRHMRAAAEILNI